MNVYYVYAVVCYSSSVDNVFQKYKNIINYKSIINSLLKIGSKQNSSIVLSEMGGFKIIHLRISATAWDLSFFLHRRLASHLVGKLSARTGPGTLIQNVAPGFAQVASPPSFSFSRVVTRTRLEVKLRSQWHSGGRPRGWWSSLALRTELKAKV